MSNDRKAFLWLVMTLIPILVLVWGGVFFDLSKEAGTASYATLCGTAFISFVTAMWYWLEG